MKVLITDAVHEEMLVKFQQANIEVDYRPNITQLEVDSIIADYELLVVNSKINADKSFLDKAKRLKMIGRLGSGKEIVDMEYAQLKQIIFHNSPEGNRDAVAEHCLGLILSLLHHIPKSLAEIKAGFWNREPNRGHELGNRTIALLGYGHTGSATASRLENFGCEILAYDKFLEGFGSSKIKEVNMQEIFEKADIVSIHLPLTALTKQLVNDEFISQFKKPIYVVNTSRGKIVSQDAMLNGFQSGKILGFASDVLENEQVATYSSSESAQLQKLLAYNTIITPHIAGWTYESKKKLAMILADKMLMSLK